MIDNIDTLKQILKKFVDVQKPCQFLFWSIIFQKGKQNIETKLNVVPSKLKIFCHQKDIFFIVNASFQKIEKVNCRWIGMVNQKSVNLWETTLCLTVFWCFKQICTCSKQIIESISNSNLNKVIIGYLNTNFLGKSLIY